MQKKIILLGTVFFMLLTMFYLSGKKEVQSRKIAIVQKLQEEEIAPTYKERKTPSPFITEEEKTSFHNALPDKNDVKDQVAKYPHRTPESLISFAETLGVLSEKAFKNSNEAGQFMKELEDCVLDVTAHESARALCLSKAHQIAKKYPELQSAADETTSKAPKEIVHLLKKQRSIFKN